MTTLLLVTVSFLHTRDIFRSICKGKLFSHILSMLKFDRVWPMMHEMEEDLAVIVLAVLLSKTG